MSIGEAGPPGDFQETPADAGDGLLRLISQAVLGAMIEDWATESVELYRLSEGTLGARELPDDTIERGSSLERRMMHWLAGEEYLVDELPSRLRDFLSLAVSGCRVMEGETASCRVVWVSSGEVAEPVFSLPVRR